MTSTDVKEKEKERKKQNKMPEDGCLEKRVKRGRNMQKYRRVKR
jgi:hypothetical protein